MLVTEAIQQIRERAGIQGDEFYSENDLLAALQTSFENYWNLILANTPSRLARELTITPAETTTTLPADVAIVRAVVKGVVILSRVPFSSPAFAGDVYDVKVTDQGVQLVVPSTLIGQQLKISYIPATPRLAFSNTTNDPLKWTAIPEGLFPTHGIILQAVAEALAKDRDPASQTFASLADRHLQLTAASLISSQAQAAPGSSVRRIIADVTNLLAETHADLARENTILSAIQRVIEQVHRVVLVIAEDVVKVSDERSVVSFPTTITLTDSAAVLDVLLKNTDGTWSRAFHADRTVESGRLGDFFDVQETSSGTNIRIWASGRTSNPTDVKISYLPRAPVLDTTTDLNPTLYPRDLIVAGVLRDLIPDPQQKSYWHGVFNERLAEFADSLSTIYIWRSFSRTSRRAALISTVRHIIGSPLQTEWRNQTIEAIADMVRSQIARQIRLIHQGFFEKDHVVSATQPVTQITMPERWARIIAIYHYPAGKNTRWFYELTHSDRDSPEFAYVSYLWDNLGYDIILSGQGVIGGDIVVRYLVHPALTAGLVTAEEPDDILFPTDVVAYLVAARMMASLKANPDQLGRGQYLEAMAQAHLKAHLAEIARLFHRAQPKRRLPLKMNYG